ncbi:LOW QUALITY PROTEIN: N-acetylmuramoyl-L-alanine amidase-like [Leucoraja erinacea]|uniref:LOW QUALITY PROTEIN: N-acetylmuramoyl-L-alanine amidase-like n=1 Tax=Leucoraja erinaceus TaxID=7782 RepID=UPI002453E1E3|nr:LOW QUALITY PROTEIN: N-acetylmuramoyl-L-alanine amidase-like [Leucoraja erinacea]
MDTGGVPQGFLSLWLLCPLLWSGYATPTYHLSNVLSIIEELEGQETGMTILNVTAVLRSLQTSDQDFRRLLLGESQAPVDLSGLLSQAKESFLREVMNHEVGRLVERGVVLTPDGTTVAMGNLVAGVEAGLKREVRSPRSGADADLWAPVDSLYALTLAKDLGLAFLAHQANKNQEMLASDGCWDDVDRPRVFTWTGPWTLATSALINGGMDGFTLGDHLAQHPPPLPRLSTLLRDYYSQAPGLLPLKARSRRMNFEATFDLGNFTGQVLGAVSLYDQLRNNSVLGDLERNTFRKMCEQGVKLFHQNYLECPAIIPRCMWGARPFKGEPIQLALPLRFIYIHHTYMPSQPCTNFPDCAANMRSIQNFHQDERQWSDIGYSFLAGSDGYMYEGRGWHWVGAHTLGQNSKGYGVSFIGNYSSELPEPTALALVRDSFTRCAVVGGKITSDYAIHGHRQHRATSCPGNALFSEITTWKAFKEVDG